MPWLSLNIFTNQLYLLRLLQILIGRKFNGSYNQVNKQKIVQI